MKKSDSSWHSPYLRRQALPRYWPWIAVALVLLIMVMSWSYSGQTVVAARDMREVIEKAAEQGDYELAGKLYEQCQVSQCQSVTQNVLGAESELEDVVYPERVVERRIMELETKLVEYPGNREIYLALAKLYAQLDNHVKASEYREKARVLDPNN